MIPGAHRGGRRRRRPIHPAARGPCFGTSQRARGSPRSAPRVALRNSCTIAPSEALRAVEASELERDRSPRRSAADFCGTQTPERSIRRRARSSCSVPQWTHAIMRLLAPFTPDHLVPSERRALVAPLTDVLHAAAIAVSKQQRDRVAWMHWRTDGQQSPVVAPVHEARAEQGERVPFAAADPRGPA